MATGYIYDPIFHQHTYPGHPENESRLTAICNQLDTLDLWNAMQQIPSRMATDTELRTIHPPSYVQQVQRISQNGGGRLDADTYMTAQSYEAAATAVGSLIDLTLAVLNGSLNNGFAIVRPPGHHAEISRGMGFCLFSTAAIAAKVVQQHGIERVAIIDFDVHHGNGSQYSLEDDPSILFFSTHQYPHYPGTGRADEIGIGLGKGSTINCPLPVAVGDNGFKALYQEILNPLLQRFQPQLIIVSAGYDAHWDDPLAQLGLSLNGLGWLSQSLIDMANEFCNGNIVFTLEGGYNLDALKHGVCNSIKALLGRTDFDDPLGTSPWPEADMRSYIKEMKVLHNL